LSQTSLILHKIHENRIGYLARAHGVIGYEQAPAFRLLSWMLQRLPRLLTDRDKGQAWKYLSDWIPLVRHARLHHELPRSGSRESDYFDLVTSDQGGKVLHLGQRLASISVSKCMVLYSFRNATTGSTNVARRAGRAQAKAATASRRAAAPA